jgi:DNA-binding Lrp family transcriptional regulator
MNKNKDKKDSFDDSRFCRKKEKVSLYYERRTKMSEEDRIAQLEKKVTQLEKTIEKYEKLWNDLFWQSKLRDLIIGIILNDYDKGGPIFQTFGRR